MNRPSPGTEWHLLGLFLAVAVDPLLSCACGGFPMIGLPVPIFAVFCAWFPRLDYERDSWKTKLVAGLARIVSALILVVNVSEMA